MPSSASQTVKESGTFSAATYFASGRYEEAAALTERAIEANGDDYNTYIPFLNALELLGRKKDAEHVRDQMVKVLRQQLELVPEDVRARILLAGNLAYLKQDAGRDHPPVADCRCASARRSEHPLQCRLHLRHPWEKGRKRWTPLRRRLQQATATRAGLPPIPISVFCTMTLNSRNWSPAANAPRRRM